MARVVVFGSLNMDLSISAERMPEAGETLQGNHFFTNPGGKGANQAVAAAKLGAHTYLIGALGVDGFGDQLLAALSAHQVRSEHVVRVEGVASGVAMIIRTQAENRILLDAGANARVTFEQVKAAIDACARPGDIFLAQLECPHDVVFEALAYARTKGLYTVLNPAPAAHIPAEVFQNLDLVCMNETECARVVGILPVSDNDAQQVAERLAAYEQLTAIITLGSKGSLVCQAGAVTRVAAQKVDAVDTTCAGDTFLGALCAAQAQEMAFDEALVWASAASALTCTRLGAQQAIPTAVEVGEFLAARKG